MTYAEFLRAQGATEEDIKVLDHPVARKAWEKSQADAAAATAAAKQLEADTRKWYDETIIPSQEKLQRERDTAVANAAAERARVKALQDQGLLEVAEADAAAKAAATASGATPPSFDPSKYVTQDTLLQVAEKEGDAIAIAQDIAAEHSYLFGNDSAKKLVFRDLRREAVQRKLSVEQVWMERFGVQAAREARAKADRDAEIAKWKSEGAKEKETELVSKYGNPDTRPAVSSTNPFTNRIPSGSGQPDVIHPWQRSETEREMSRIQKALKNQPVVM